MLTVDALNQISLFVGIDQRTAEDVWALGKVIHHEQGDQLFERGSEANELLIIESGSVALFFPVPILGAIKEVVVEHAGPGDLLAWSALVNPYTLTLSARCVESGAVRAFGREVLCDHLDRHSEVGQVLMRNLARVVGRRLQDFQNLWLLEVQAKIIGRLE